MGETLRKPLSKRPHQCRLCENKELPWITLEEGEINALTHFVCCMTEMSKEFDKPIQGFYGFETEHIADAISTVLKIPLDPSKWRYEGWAPLEICKLTPPNLHVYMYKIFKLWKKLAAEKKTFSSHKQRRKWPKHMQKQCNDLQRDIRSDYFKDGHLRGYAEIWLTMGVNSDTFYHSTPIHCLRQSLLNLYPAKGHQDLILVQSLLENFDGKLPAALQPHWFALYNFHQLAMKTLLYFSLPLDMSFVLDTPANTERDELIQSLEKAMKERAVFILEPVPP
jgi:hypothetical protein